MSFTLTTCTFFSLTKAKRCCCYLIRSFFLNAWFVAFRTMSSLKSSIKQVHGTTRLFEWNFLKRPLKSWWHEESFLSHLHQTRWFTVQRFESINILQKKQIRKQNIIYQKQVNQLFDTESQWRCKLDSRIHSIASRVVSHQRLTATVEFKSNFWEIIFLSSYSSSWFQVYSRIRSSSSKLITFASTFSPKVTVFFVGIFAPGIIGNVIVCVVIVKNASMHTATNYYLFSLAVSDLLFLMMGKSMKIMA